MAKDLNKVQVIGYLGVDPDLRYTQQGTAMTELVAHDMIMLSSRNERPSQTDEESARPRAATAATPDANPVGDAPIIEAPAARRGGHAAARARATEGAATPPPDDLPF